MTIRKRPSLSPSEVKWRTLRLARVLFPLGLVFALITIPYGAYCLRRDRPSLEWPVILGVISQADVVERSGRHHSTHLTVTYVYKVNGTRYVSHQIRLWSSDLSRAGDARLFAQAHRVHSFIDVHYDPLNPANAVLIPGADEFTDRLDIYAGIMVALLATIQFFRTRKDYARVAAQRRKVRTASSAAPKSELSAEPFLTYEPGSKRKLNVFPDRECVLDMLDQGKTLQEWKPDDRIIDVSGRVYRIVGRADGKSYDMELTGEIWEWNRLLALAVADAALIKRNPRAIERRAEETPDADKIAVIMECVSELPAAPLWLWIALGLFFLLFFLAVMFGAGYLFRWLGK